MKLLVYKTAKKLGICPARVFGLAFEYAEDFQKRATIIQIYNDWIFRDILHPTVESFCLDTLANRAQPI